MSDLGEVLLAVIFFLCAFATAFALIALKLRAEIAKKVLALARGAILIAAGLAVAVLILLIVAFLNNDFSIDVVRQYSSIELPLFYKLSALWAGSTGSLVLWSVAVFVLFALWQIANSNKQVAISDKQLAISNLKFGAIALSIGAGVCLTFTALLIFLAKPFAASPAIVDDGIGLNPLLQNFWMIIHPPLLFVGYSAFLIPFVVVLASVFAGRAEDSEIYKQLQPWLLFAICFLGAGIAAGARWSYIELGWGGYWAWDPVENVSLLPWLVALAALHSLIGIRVADKFRFWTIILAPLPFILCLFASFVARSGILPSLHSFTVSVMSSALSAFIGGCFLLWLICVILALKSVSIRPSRPSVFRLDKSDALFWANVVFIFTAVAIGIATFWPVIWQALTSSDSGVTLPPIFYNHVVLLAALLLTLLLGFAALADLQKNRSFTLQLLACCSVGLLCFGLVFRFVEKQFLIDLACGICAFSFVAVLVKLALNLKGTGQIASGIAHLGLLLLVVAICFSSDKQSVQTVLNKKGRFELGKYELFYESFKRKSFAGVTQEGPEIVLTKEGLQKVLWPHTSLYPDGQSTAEVAVYTGLLEDVYISFDGVSRAGGVIITAKIKPFMFWLWLAAVLIVVGLALGLSKKNP